MAGACSLSNFKFDNITIIPLVVVDTSIADSGKVIEPRGWLAKSVAFRYSQDFLASIKDLSADKQNLGA
jgi:hypothetical protein